MADQINYYEVLGVSREASQTEIRNAYRNLAKERHPDHPGGSTEEFSRLQEANAVLSDPNRRRKHDEALDLAHAADQLAGLNFDFDAAEDELSAKRREREASGPSLGERLRDRFGRKEEDPYEELRREARGSGRGSGRSDPRALRRQRGPLVRTPPLRPRACLPQERGHHLRRGLPGVYRRRPDRAVGDADNQPWPLRLPDGPGSLHADPVLAGRAGGGVLRVQGRGLRGAGARLRGRARRRRPGDPRGCCSS